MKAVLTKCIQRKQENYQSNTPSLRKKERKKPKMFNYKISFAQKVSLDDGTFNQAIDAMYDIRFEDEVSEELRNKFASSKWDINYRDFFINVSMEEELEAQEMAEAAVWFSDVLKIFTVRVTRA